MARITVITAATVSITTAIAATPAAKSIRAPSNAMAADTRLTSANQSIHVILAPGGYGTDGIIYVIVIIYVFHLSPKSGLESQI